MEYSSDFEEKKSRNSHSPIQLPSLKSPPSLLLCTIAADCSLYLLLASDFFVEEDEAQLRRWKSPPKNKAKNCTTFHFEITIYGKERKRFGFGDLMLGVF